MGMRFVHNVDDLASDLTKIAADFKAGAPKRVGDSAREGNAEAKRIARARYGKGHARKYPGTFTSERMSPFLGFGVGVYAAEYGPVARGQGNLAPILERGSINNPAHHNLDQSADLCGPKFARDMLDFADGLFWPGGDA